MSSSFWPSAATFGLLAVLLGGFFSQRLCHRRPWQCRTHHPWGSSRKAFFGQILHYPQISNNLPKGQIWSQHFVKIIWKITVERARLVGMDIDIILQWVRIDFSWKCQQTKHLQSLMVFASFKLNWFHQTPGMFSIIGFGYGAGYIPKMTSVLEYNFPFHF